MTAADRLRAMLADAESDAAFDRHCDTCSRCAGTGAVLCAVGAGLARPYRRPDHEGDAAALRDALAFMALGDGAVPLSTRLFGTGTGVCLDIIAHHTDAPTETDARRALAARLIATARGLLEADRA